MLAETVHGIARTLLLEPLVGDLRARQIAVFTGSLIIMAIAVMTIRWIGERQPSRLFALGVMWVALTVAFEIGLGRFVFGYPWPRLASDYDLTAGGLLPLGLLVMALSPWIADRVRG